MKEKIAAPCRRDEPVDAQRRYWLCFFLKTDPGLLGKAHTEKIKRSKYLDLERVR
jgi:hypothetical protein